MNPHHRESCDRVDDDEVHLQIDAYGIKTRIRSRWPPGGKQPASWREVWERVQTHLRRICVDLPGGVADAVATIRSILQGLGRLSRASGALPEAICKRIERAHAVVETIEDQKQQALLTEMGTVAESDHTDCRPIAMPRLQAKLAELRARGFRAELYQDEDGIWVIVVLPPGELETR